MNRLTNKAFLQKVKESVHSIDPQADVYLFGSRARGNHRKDSDWDFLVLTEKKLDQQLEYAIWDTFTELELASEQIINPVVQEKQEWIKHPFSPFYWNVLTDGKPI
ncbi:nucleotidyltransferase domain-containing protein [Larkinella humicola]|uniref:Nucleotidyltransferase domain-containing protein n=1 Tax=Larkinella humicola TaxID=2607654 RepID=A0A5N1JCT1_9BACT|nr:nucleotidyltransferase domain-containing protein [Larkinella humicola]KAA9352903.1 nucleotidyltransferase domain-containing protein [Larkinella humicola]